MSNDLTPSGKNLPYPFPEQSEKFLYFDCCLMIKSQFRLTQSAGIKGKSNIKFSKTFYSMQNLRYRDTDCSSLSYFAKKRKNNFKTSVSRTVFLSSLAIVIKLEKPAIPEVKHLELYRLSVGLHLLKKVESTV